jgi:hypothetical protein
MSLPFREPSLRELKDDNGRSLVSREARRCFRRRDNIGAGKPLLDRTSASFAHRQNREHLEVCVVVIVRRLGLGELCQAVTAICHVLILYESM